MGYLLILIKCILHDLHAKNLERTCRVIYISAKNESLLFIFLYDVQFLNNILIPSLLITAIIRIIDHTYADFVRSQESLVQTE